MSRWICIDNICIPSDENDWDELVVFADAVAEQEPIDLVHCVECKKAHLTYDGECKYCDEWRDDDGNYIEVYHDGNHYCSYGVRKESE